MVERERVQQIIDETDWSIEEEYYEPDPYFYVLGLDPGGTTGVAMLRVNTEDDTINPELVYLHQIKNGRYGFKDWFYGSQVAHNVVIVSEKWKERNVKGADREPQYIEGSMHMLWDDDNINYQYPEQKELIPDQWLKDNNLWTEGKRHQMDALKHAFAYLRNEEHSATLESLSGKPESGEGEGEGTQPMAQPGEAEAAQIEEPGEGEGDEAEGEGDGQGESGAEGAANAAKAMMDALKRMGDAAEQAAQRIKEVADNIDPDETHTGGTSGGGGEGIDNEWDSTKIEVKGERSRRERNGAFAGFNPADYESGGTTLLDD